MTLPFSDYPILPKRPDGWYFGTPHADWPEAGPYSTRQECEEARSSFCRNWIGNFKPSQAVTTSAASVAVLVILCLLAGCSQSRSLIIRADWTEGQPATASVELKTDLS